MSTLKCLQGYALCEMHLMQIKCNSLIDWKVKCLQTDGEQDRITNRLIRNILFNFWKIKRYSTYELWNEVILIKGTWNRAVKEGKHIVEAGTTTTRLKRTYFYIQYACAYWRFIDLLKIMISISHSLISNTTVSLNPIIPFAKKTQQSQKLAKWVSSVKDF